jgi:plastocyanin
MGTVVKLLRATAVAGALLSILSTAGMAAEYEITVAKMKFSAPPAELHVGDVIVWRNNDILRHTATARDKSFDVDLPQKSEGRLTITKAGAVDYFCRFHPAMVGKLDVQP